MARVNKAEQYAMMDVKDMMKLSEKELREVVSVMASTANKRLKRMKQAGETSPSYEMAMKRSYTTEQGGKFGVKGKSFNQLRNEFKATSTFLKGRTSGLKKFGEYRKEVYKRIGGKFESKAQERAFWRNYRKFEEGVGAKSFDSNQAQRNVRKIMQGDTTDMIRKVNEANVPEGDNREESIKKFTEARMILTEDGELITIGRDERSILTLMTEEHRINYEREQSTGNRPASDGYVTIQQNK